MGVIIFLVCLLVICAVAVYFLIDDNEAGLATFFTFMGCMVAALLIGALTEYSTIERKTSDYSVKKEIRKVDVNGTIVSTDTVYVITKKKKNN